MGGKKHVKYMTNLSAFFMNYMKRLLFSGNFLLFEVKVRFFYFYSEDIHIMKPVVIVTSVTSSVNRRECS